MDEFWEFDPVSFAAGYFLARGKITPSLERLEIVDTYFEYLRPVAAAMSEFLDTPVRVTRTQEGKKRYRILLRGNRFYAFLRYIQPALKGTPMEEEVEDIMGVAPEELFDKPIRWPWDT